MRVGVQGGELVQQCGRGVKHFAVDMQLALVPGAVADADRELERQPGRWVSSSSDRSCSPPTPYMMKVPAGRPGGDRLSQELEEFPGLIRTGGRPQRLQGHARVPDPGVPGSPSCVSRRRPRAGMWWGWRRLPRWRSRSRPAGTGHWPHEIVPWTVVVLMQLRPAGPALHSVREPARNLLLIPHGRRVLPALFVMKGEAHRFSGSQRQPCPGAVAAEIKLNRAGQRQDIGPAANSQPAGGFAQERTFRPYSGRDAKTRSTSTEPLVHDTCHSSTPGDSAPRL